MLKSSEIRVLASSSKVHIEKKEEENKSVIYIPNINSILNDIEKRLEEHKEILMKEGFHKKLIKIINKSINDDYTEMVFLKPLSVRKEYPDNAVYIRLKDLGSGIEKIMKIMVLMEIIKPKLLLIDDFEAGLHPSLLQIFLEWLQDKDWQTILTTHSIDALYLLTEIRLYDTSVVQISKSKEDVLDFRVLDLERLDRFLDANVDPRSLIDLLDL